MDNLFSNALSRKVMLEVKSYIENLAMIEGKAVLIKKAFKCVKLICQKYSLSCAFDRSTCQFRILQNKKVVGIMPIYRVDLNSIRSLGILYGDAG